MKGFLQATTVTVTALTIAGSDPSGGAGLQADLKIFHQFQLYGTSVVTLLTVQNTTGVSQIELMKPEFVLAQLDAVLDDIPPCAAKTGALGSPDIIAAIAGRAKEFDFPLVVDPVMISKHGHWLMDTDAIEVLVTDLLPLATLVTPNRWESEQITGIKIVDLESALEAADAMMTLGFQNVLIKCGPLAFAAEQTEASSNGSRETDQPEVEQVSLFRTPTDCVEIRLPHLDSKQTHGTGCVLSAAITAGLANGNALQSAVEYATVYVHQAIATAPLLGRGFGPTEMRVAVASRQAEEN